MEEDATCSRLDDVPNLLKYHMPWNRANQLARQVCRRSKQCQLDNFGYRHRQSVMSQLGIKSWTLHTWHVSVFSIIITYYSCHYSLKYNYPINLHFCYFLSLHSNMFLPSPSLYNWCYYYCTLTERSALVSPLASHRKSSFDPVPPF